VLPIPAEKLWSSCMSSRRGDGTFERIESPALALVPVLPAPGKIKIDR
jgi:hypothetical protein